MRRPSSPSLTACRADRAPESAHILRIGSLTPSPARRTNSQISPTTSRCIEDQADRRPLSLDSVARLAPDTSQALAGALARAELIRNPPLKPRGSQHLIVHYPNGFASTSSVVGKTWPEKADYQSTTSTLSQPSGQTDTPTHARQRDTKSIKECSPASRFHSAPDIAPHRSNCADLPPFTGERERASCDFRIDFSPRLNRSSSRQPKVSNLQQRFDISQSAASSSLPSI